MQDPRTVRFEGYTPDELTALPNADFDALVLSGKPFAFSAGSAEVLGQFRIDGARLVIELAQIEGGGEGVLLSLWLLAEKLARRRRLAEVEWIVHAVHCARPNPRLRAVLEARGFVVEAVAGAGEAYHLVRRVPAAPPNG